MTEHCLSAVSWQSQNVNQQNAAVVWNAQQSVNPVWMYAQTVQIWPSLCHIIKCDRLYMLTECVTNAVTARHSVHTTAPLTKISLPSITVLPTLKTAVTAVFWSQAAIVLRSVLKAMSLMPLLVTAHCHRGSMISLKQ